MRVFLSSTATDLVEHRKVADDTLLRLMTQSVVMERFGPQPGTPVDECERLAAESDAVVCIVAHRYGHEPEPGKGSITRREVEAAKRAGKPVYAWIVDDACAWTGVKESDRLNEPAVQDDPAQQQQVLAAIKALREFKVWLRANVACDKFSDPENLGRLIATSLQTQAQQPQRGASRPTAVLAEIRVIHALQPAPHFQGREALVDKLLAWVDDLASPDRVHALVAAGGTGKTAVVEQVLRQLHTRGLVPGTWRSG